MIANLHERRVAVNKLAELRDALAHDINLPTGRDPEMDALVASSKAALISDVETELAEYDALAAGHHIPVVDFGTLEGLGDDLIRLRIAAGLSQRQLADKLKLHEGVIRRYERERYAASSLHRLREIAAILTATPTVTKSETAEPVSLENGTPRTVTQMADEEVDIAVADLEALYESATERSFEVMFIVDVTLDNQVIQTVINRSIEQIETLGASVGRVAKWGRRKLAYDIDQKPDGYYVLIEISVDPTKIADIDRALFLANEILRHKIIKVPAIFESRSLTHSPTETPDEAATR